METISLTKIRIIVLGANGQLAQEFRYLAPSMEHMVFLFLSRQQLDVNDEENIKQILDEFQPDYVINCAAYTAVDKAEEEVEKCYKINAQACTNLVNVLTNYPVKLVHFSSDYVYHSYNGFPLLETDNTNPKGVYAKSKLEGENILRQSGVPCLIIRTSWVISSFGHNFVKTMMRLGAEKESINVVNDQYGAPTYARHLAQAVFDIITHVVVDPKKETAFDDTYNFANEGIITWYDLAKSIMDISTLPCKVSPIPSLQYPTPAERPFWSVMSKKKIKTAFGVDTPHWYEALQECLEAMQS